VSEKPEALRLANALRDGTYLLSAERDGTEAALRRQHAEIERLRGLLAEASKAVWMNYQNDLLDRIEAALKEMPR
jgi:hypothetical protein